MSPRPRSAAVVAALLAWTLTACSDDPEPIVEPTPSPTSTAPTEPTSPPTSEPPERESAEQFIRRWQGVSFEMQNTGNVDNYLAMTRSCGSCEALAQGVSEIYADGGYVDNARGAVSSIERAGKVDDVFIYEFDLRTRPSQIVDREGEVETELSGGQARFQINLEMQGDTWIVTRISRLAE